MGAVEKRIQAADPSKLARPAMSEQDWHDFFEGITLFNQGRFWESHEAWEQLWKRHPEGSRLFFQGLIQVAAGYYQLQRNIFHGANKHLENALWKLEAFQPRCLGVDVRRLVQTVDAALKEIGRLGEKDLHRFPGNLIPTIKVIDEKQDPEN